MARELAVSRPNDASLPLDIRPVISPPESRRPFEFPISRVVVDEGHGFLGGHRGRFDFIVVDGFDEKGRTGSLETVAFYAACRAHLTARGVVSTHLLTRRRGIAASETRMREVFAENVLVLPPPEAGDTVALMGLEPPPPASFPVLREAARVLRARTGLNLGATLARLEGSGE